MAAAHARGARVYVDAVHAAPHRPLDVSRLGCDALACSAYKWFGPHVGILCASPELLAELEPDRLRPAPQDPPDSWEQGTAAFESLAGVRAAADYVRSVGFEAIGAHEHGLLERALDGLSAIEGVTLYGGAKERAPTMMFRVGTVHPKEAAAALAERGVAVWHGNYYAHELERFLGLAPDGALRAGFVHYNDTGDVDRLVDGVRALAERGGS